MIHILYVSTAHPKHRGPPRDLAGTCSIDPLKCLQPSGRFKPDIVAPGSMLVLHCHLVRPSIHISALLYSMSALLYTVSALLCTLSALLYTYPPFHTPPILLVALGAIQARHRCAWLHAGTGQVANCSIF